MTKKDLGLEENINLENIKIFITGITGTGKTHLANRIEKELSIPHIKFDEIWRYDIVELNEKIFQTLPNSFVMDAIPYTNDYNVFQQYRNNNQNVYVICTFKSNLIDWIKKIIDKPYFTQKGPDLKTDNPTFNVTLWASWIYFYSNLVYKLDPNYFFDNSINQGFKLEEFEKMKIELIKTVNELNNKRQHVFKDYIDSLSYDKFYQDIECINFKGYSKSWQTWDNIKDLIDWKDKSVIDLGCFHGYFSFKAEQAGAIGIIGLEKNDIILETANKIKHMFRSKAIFQKWEGGESTPQADVALVLNMLHHTKDKEKTLQNINAKFAIFEIEKSQIELIKKYYTIIKEVVSHRVDASQNRTILLGQKNV